MTSPPIFRRIVPVIGSPVIGSPVIGQVSAMITQKKVVVDSMTRNGNSYTVSLDGTCTCPDFTNRGPRRCKHIDYVCINFKKYNLTNGERNRLNGCKYTFA